MGAILESMPPQEAPASLSAPCRVLVVDDSVDSAETIAELLRIWGHEVSTAHDGPQALAVAREKKPEVILLDIGLPEMDGYEVARQLRAESLGGRLLIALTGYSGDSDRELVKQAGFDRHMIKPVDPEALQKLLR
jgi:CheY-like chemotaxis protein